MKQNCVRSDRQPNVIEVEQLGATKFDVSVIENVREVPVTRCKRGGTENETEEIKRYEFERYNAVIDANDYGTFIAAAIHVRYSSDDELALINKAIADAENEEYKAYRAFVADIKAEAVKYFDKE